MEVYCRGCLVQYNDPSELIQYTEKNRRLFIYCTGIQVKLNDSFTFQLCKDCYLNMQVSCKFKKLCHNSDKRIKNYLALKNSGENVDLSTYLKTNDDSITFRLPLLGNSTPDKSNVKDEDNESTCTSIQNFINDIMASEEIPATEARIIREVIEEEADVLDDSLDSHWLQDDLSIDNSCKLDFSFSPFVTPNYVNEDSPKKFINEIIKKEPEEAVTFKTPEDISVKVEFKLEDCNEMETKCTIDQNLENALQNENNENVFLEDLLVTPPLQSNISGPPTPVINDILFGEKLESDSENSLMKNIGKCIEEFKPVKTENDVLEEILAETVKEFDIDGDIEMKTEILKEKNTYKNKGKRKINDKKRKQLATKCSSPDENKYSVTNFYCKMCNKQFKNLAALKVHCGRKHKLRINYINPDPKIGKPRICDYCGVIYHRLPQFIRHIKSHTKTVTPRSYVCQLCSLKFTSKAKLDMHQNTHKTKSLDPQNEKKFVCTICGAGSSSATNLKTHLRRHSKNYTVHCEQCGRGFYRKTDLTTHYRLHTGEKPYPCEHCNRTFARRDVLNRHMKCHTDEKPFVCPYCDIRYSKKYNLLAHLEKGKSCRSTLPTEGKDDSNVAVYYAPVVGNDVIVDENEAKELEKDSNADET
ncbi:PREDICTED: zinc finger protein 568-like [Papilio polytes]|uniref:zinc finger protein 568-like n=1 Tax=Papilio polytes TaxID=76194 RepID=UPI0006760EBA|nr:PREDICTED: zinc finger protein 568-like [Papilio polytes]